MTAACIPKRDHLGSPAGAQVADTGIAVAEETAQTDVIVTGSRIARPDLTSAIPITVTSNVDIQQDAALDIQDTL